MSAHYAQAATEGARDAQAQFCNMWGRACQGMQREKRGGQ